MAQSSEHEASEAHAIAHAPRKYSYVSLETYMVQSSLRRSLGQLEVVEGSQSAAAVQGRCCLATLLGRIGSASSLLEALQLATSVAASRRRIHGAEHTKARAAADYVEKLRGTLCRTALSSPLP